ncbi:MAG: hypothetical protein V7607_4998 [Solirubrobacteraceae bacterium]
MSDNRAARLSTERAFGAEHRTSFIRMERAAICMR